MGPMRSLILLSTLLLACGGSQTTAGGGTTGGDGTDTTDTTGGTTDTTDPVDDGTGVVVNGEPPKLCVDVPTVDDEDYQYPYSDLLKEAIGIEAKPDPTTWIIEAMGDEDQINITDILHIHDGTWVYLYTRCGGGSTCSVHLARAVQVSADDRYEVKKSIELTFDEPPFGEMADGLEIAAFGFGDFNADKAPELWMFLDISGEPEAAVGESVHSYMAIYTLPDLDELAWVKLGVRAGAAYGDSCAAYVALYDLSCNDHPDVLISTECGMTMCIDDPDDPECKEPNAFSRETLVWMPDVGRYFAASHDWDVAAIEKARGGE